MHVSFVLFLGYVKQIFDEVIRLRTVYPTIAKASANAKLVLPQEPCSLVEKYLANRERQPKEEIVAARHTCYSQLALPLLHREDITCYCKGKCATRACTCRSNEIPCKADCKCKKTKCNNN